MRTIKEGQSLLSEMGTREAHRAYQLEAQLAIARQELHQAFARETPAQKSRKCYSRPAIYLQTARRAAQA